MRSKRHLSNMASLELSEQEEQKANEFLEEIKSIKHDETLSTRDAIKFLMARKFEIRRAVDLYQAHELVRNKEGFNQLDLDDKQFRKELLLEKFTVLPSRDTTGASIALFTARLHQPLTTTHQSVLQALVFQLDCAIDDIETQRNGLVFIYDMTEAKYGNFDYDLSIKILNLLKGSYPARLKKILIVTAPLWFKASLRILRLFIREKLRDRVLTVNLEQLPEHIPKEALPKQLGGHLDSSHKDWLQQCLEKMCTKNTSAIVCSPEEILQNWENEKCDIIDLSSSDDSIDTVNEKHSQEDSEKNGKEKEVSVEKEDIVNGLGDSAVHNNVDLKHTGTNKRTGDRADLPDIPLDTCAPPLPYKKRSPSPSVNHDSIHTVHVNDYSVEDLIEALKTKGRKGLYREYAMIKADIPPSSDFSISRANYNLHKNRYTDVLCLDASRVKLSITEDDPSCDYINANFVDGYQHKQAFISTQGPLPRTFNDFWRMVWEQKVLTIVMTTRTVERGRLKCGQYWPLEEDQVEQYGDFLVANTDIEHYDGYVVTNIILQNQKTDESRVLSHFQFTSWPDYGVPHSAESFLLFLSHVRRHQYEVVEKLGSKWTGHPDGPPIVVHCSAGIGRTGTFITMDINIRKLASEGQVNIHETVRRIRSHRAFSIQMPDQYVFCHLALIEHSLREGYIQDVDLEGFDDSDSSDSD